MPNLSISQRRTKKMHIYTTRNRFYARCSKNINIGFYSNNQSNADIKTKQLSLRDEKIP